MPQNVPPEIIEESDCQCRLDYADIEFLRNQLDDLTIAVDPASRMRSQSSTSFIIQVEDNIKGLSRLLKIFEDMDVDILHIESRRPQHRDGSEVENTPSEMFLDVDCNSSQLECLIMEVSSAVRLIAVQLPAAFRAMERRNYGGEQFWPPGEGEAHAKTLIGRQEISENIMDFPKRIQDIDKLGKMPFSLSAEHPGYSNSRYMQRRNYFAEIAYSNIYGQAIPTIDYTDYEINTWKSLYNELTQLYPTHACKEFYDNLGLLQKYCGYREDRIPQLETISNYVRDKTGFTLRLAATELSARDFLAGLAFRVFHCTQHVRFEGQLHSTPDPDCCHDLLGHVPMLLNESYAGFLQEIGLLSLGAPDQDVWKLAKYYFFTAEYGLYEQNGEVKALGAELLTSVGELTLALSGKTTMLEFNPDEAVVINCEISGFPKVYYYLTDIEEARNQLRKWSKCLERPFDVRYNALMNQMEILDNKEFIQKVVNDLKNDMTTVRRAFQHLAKTECRGFSRLLGARLSATFECAEENPELDSCSDRE